MSSVNKVMLSAVVTAMLGSSIAQAAFADGKITTVTTRNYGTPVVVGTPVIIEQNPTTTTTTVTRRVDQPVLVEHSTPVIMERQTVVSTPVYNAPIVQERRVEVLNNSLPSSSTTVTRTTIERN